MNNNIVKTFFLLLFVLMGQISLMAEKGENKIIYKQGKHIYIVKDKEDNIIKARYDGDLIKEIDIRPSDSLIIYFEVLSDNGYQLLFPLDRSENKWPGDNGVDKINNKNFLYKLSSSTEKITIAQNTTKPSIDKVIATKYKFSEKHHGESLNFINKDNENDIVLTINVLEPVVFEGLKWYLTFDSDDDNYIYSNEGQLELNKNTIHKITLKESEIPNDSLIKLATFSIKNNTSNTINWKMPSDNNLSTVKYLKIYSSEDTLHKSNFKDKVEGSAVKKYFIGIHKNNIEDINNRDGYIPIRFVYEENTVFGSSDIPKLHIKVVEKDCGFVAFLIENWHWLILGFLIIVVLVFIYLKFISKAHKSGENGNDARGGKNGDDKEKEYDKSVGIEQKGTLKRKFKNNVSFHTSKTDKTEINNEEPKQKPTNIPAQSDEDKNENVLRALGLLISKKIKAEGGDLGTVLVKLVNENQPLPDNLKDKKTLLDYINNKNESQLDELDKFLKTFEEIKRKYNLNSLSELISSMEDLDILNKQFDRLKSYGNKRNLTFNQNDFASNYEKEFVELDEQLKELKSNLKTKDAENKKEIDQLKQKNEETIKENESNYKSQLEKVNDSLNGYKGELKLRGLDYISGLQFCAEELEKIYIGIRSSAHQSSDIVITEFVAPILKGDHSIRNSKEGGLSGFINKLNDRDLLMQLMGVNSWEELKEGDPETKRLFVKNLVEGSDFLTIIDSVSALYAYSRVRFKDGSIDIDVSRDFSKRGIDYDEIAIAYGILRSTLKSLFSIDIITCELFKEKLDESIHEKGNARRFKDLGDRYIAIEGQVGPQVIVDIIKVGLKSEKYKIDRKAVVAHK